MKTNLIKKLALTLAVTATMGATTTFVGCNAELQNDIIANLGADSSTPISDIICIAPETSSTEYYISFIAHYDTGLSGGYYTPAKYENHKDYRITYKVSKDDYSQILKMSNEGSLVSFYKLTNKDEYEFINNLISTYDPVDVQEYIKEETELDHSYSEEYYYNPEN